jgi:adenosylcobinamide amidohydrolase
MSPPPPACVSRPGRRYPLGPAILTLGQGRSTSSLLSQVPLTDAALVNAVMTLTEAKTQAVLDAGFPGTGTATDSVCVAVPLGEGEAFAGPRSTWGARLARATYEAVLAGSRQYAARL